jgi:archaellum biogenesis ATPase FlaH
MEVIREPLSEPLHEPQLDTILMVEKAIMDAEDYPTRTGLWHSLPRKVQYQTFKRILDYLEASGKITFNGKVIIYTGVNNPKLQALMKSCVRVR